MTSRLESNSRQMNLAQRLRQGRCLKPQSGTRSRYPGRTHTSGWIHELGTQAEGEAEVAEAPGWGRAAGVGRTGGAGKPHRKLRKLRKRLSDLASDVADVSQPYSCCCL